MRLSIQGNNALADSPDYTFIQHEMADRDPFAAVTSAAEPSDVHG